MLDDPYVAPHHAVIDADGDGRLTLRVLDTRNGVAHDGRQLARGDACVLADNGPELQAGATRLRLRLAGEAPAPERVMPGVRPGQRTTLAVIALALLALVLAEQWVALDPGADYSAWLPAIVGLPVMLVAWCGAWALASKLFQHRFDFGAHFALALPWLLALALVDSLQPALAAMLAAPGLWQLTGPATALLAALLVRAHLMHVLPMQRRVVSAGVAALLLAGGGLQMALTWRSTDSLRPQPYMSTLPLPALRVAGTVPPQALVQDIAPLVRALQQRVAKAKRDEPEAEAN